MIRNCAALVSINQIISHIPGHVYWKDIHGFYQGCNQELATTLKIIEPPAIIGKTIGDFLPPEKEKLIQRIDELVISGACSVEIEETGFDQQGNEAIYLTKKSPLLNQDNVIVGLVGISLNITAQKQDEARLLAANKQAELNIRKYVSAEIAKKQATLEEVQKALKNLSQRKYYLGEEFNGNYLTRREAECIICLIRGYSAKSIGRTLGLSARTVESYLANIRGKFFCKTKLQLINKMLSANLIDAENLRLLSISKE